MRFPVSFPFPICYIFFSPVLINNPVTLQKTKGILLVGSIRIAAVLHPRPLPAIIKGPRPSLSLARTIRPQLV